MPTQDSPLWMTPAALAHLEEELAELTAVGREEFSDDQARIIELRALIRRAEVSTKPDDGIVEPGMTVTVRFEVDGSTQTLLLGDREILGTDENYDPCSPDSPLGRAIVGRKVGESASYAAPSGATIEVAIVAAAPYV